MASKVRNNKKVTSAKAVKPLTPPDLEQCQAEVPNGYSFMTLGGTPGRRRCLNKPAFIATENKPDEHGRKGSMTLCESCLKVFKKQVHHTFATVTKITGWQTLKCDCCPRPVRYQHPKGGMRCARCPRPE